MAQTDKLEVIVNDIQDLSPEKLDSVHQYILQLKGQGKTPDQVKAEMMAFAGSWADMSEEEYKTRMSDIVQHRQQAFDLGKKP